MNALTFSYEINYLNWCCNYIYLLSYEIYAVR